MVSALGTGGKLGGIRKGSPGSGVFRDTWRSLREGPKGHSVWLSGHKAYFEGGFRLVPQDAWHSPKLCSERGCEGDFEGWLPGHAAFSEGWSGRGSDGGFERRHSAGLREGFERLIGRASGTRVIFRKGSEGVYRSAFEGASGRLSSLDLGSTAGIHPVRSDRGENRSDWPKYVGDVGRWIPDLRLGLVG